MINSHFTALSGPLVRSEGRRGVGHLNAIATLAERAGKRGPLVIAAVAYIHIEIER